MKKSRGSTKPLLRGYIHQEAFFFSLGACALLITKSSTSVTLMASLIYSIGLLSLFGISAIYHRPHWEPQKRAILKRLDHCAIFILIASTATPMSMLGLSKESNFQFMLVLWITAFIGVLQSIFWVKAPKAVTSLFYIIMGWMASPFISEFYQSLGGVQISLIVGGGVVYSVGALFYAFKKPNFFPGVFGYHELFHTFTLIGAALHFIVIYQLIV